MSLWNIPVRSTTDAFTEQVELDGLIYNMAFRWNARDQHWFLSMSIDDEPVLMGIKLTISDDLLSYARRILHVPPGRLSVVDLDGLFRDPDATLFGDRVVLRYQDA